MGKSRSNGGAVNRDATYRWMDLDAFEASRISLCARYGDDIAETGSACGRGYMRLPQVENAEFDDAAAELLEAGCEVFELIADSCASLECVLEELLGPGGLAGVHGVTTASERAVIEWRGDLFLLFDFLDTLDITFERRAVLPLLDASLIAIARVLWRAPDVDESRILERAAEGPGI